MPSPRQPEQIESDDLRVPQRQPWEKPTPTPEAARRMLLRARRHVMTKLWDVDNSERWAEACQLAARDLMIAQSYVQIEIDRSGVSSDEYTRTKTRK